MNRSAAAPAPVSSAPVSPAPVSPALASAVDGWRAWLSDERRVSANTVEAYGHDLDAFLAFLCRHLGSAPGLGDLETLTPADFRGYLAERASSGLARSSISLCRRRESRPSRKTDCA